MKIQLKIKSLDKTSLLLYINFVKIILKKIKLKEVTIQNLPLKRKRITLLKSPHVDKKAREQFELQIHKSLINFQNAKTYYLIKNILINKPKNLKFSFKQIN